MKTKTLIVIFLLTLFCVSSVFAQIQESDLASEFIQIQNIKFPQNIVQKESYSLPATNSLTLEQKKFQSLVKPIISKRGRIEIDSERKTFIITDLKSRVKFQKEYFEIIDRSNLTFEQIVAAEADEKQIQSEVIFVKNLDFSISCGGGESQLSWQQRQGEIVFSLIKNFLSTKGTIEIDARVKTISVTDDLDRISVIKQIIALFDKQLLEE